MAAGLRVNLLGRSTVTFDGEDRQLSPTALAVLARLLVAAGELVPVDQLFRDVWRYPDPVVRRADRISVQQRILELRRAIDPDNPGEASRVLRTERGAVTAYALKLPRAQVDIFEFQDLVRQAQYSEPVRTIEFLHEALALWQGQPLFDVANYPFATLTIRRMHELHHRARLELLNAYRDAGMIAEAIQAVDALLQIDPEDAHAGAVLHELRSQRQNSACVLRHEFRQVRMVLNVVVGDLFSQTGADLVVGFTDTFDTATDNDALISSSSLQGRLLDHCYGGDRQRLDADIRRALQHAQRVGTETRATKRLGKLVRYPIGTTLTLRAPDGRRVYAVAYSRLGNDLVARSGPQEIRLGLDALWRSVRLHGQLRPVAVPLIGQGLSRIDSLTSDQVIEMILSTCLDLAEQAPLCRELRIVIRPEDLGKVDLLRIRRITRDL